MSQNSRHLSTALEHLALLDLGAVERRDRVKLDTANWLLETVERHQLRNEHVNHRVPRHRSLRVVRKRG